MTTVKITIIADEIGLKINIDDKVILNIEYDRNMQEDIIRTIITNLGCLLDDYVQEIIKKVRKP